MTELAITVTVDKVGERNKAMLPRSGTCGKAVITGAEEFPITVAWAIEDYHNPRSRGNYGFDEWGDPEDMLTHHRIRTDPPHKQLGKDTARRLKRAIWDKLEQDACHLEVLTLIEERDEEKEKQ